MPYGYGSANKSSSKKSTGTKAQETYRTSKSYRSSVSGKQARASKEKFETAVGKAKLDNYQVPKSNTGIKTVDTVLNVTQPFRQKTFEVNREYFQKNVAGKRGYKNTFADYQRYITGRGQGTLDAMGRPIQSNDRGDNQKTILGSTQQQTVEAPAQTPTPVETEEDIKKKRSTNILGSNYGQRTMLISSAGDETEANVSKTVLGGSVRKRI